MSTRDLLIDAAIALFNERGVANVSVRDIAAARSISAGNLTYHFANKDLLIEAVLAALIGEMESATAFALQSEPTLADYYDLLQQVWAIQRKYAFFYLDAVEILRAYPSARRLYRGAVLRRLGQSKRLLSRLAEQGLLEPLSARELDALVKRSWLVLASWPYRLFVLEEEPSRAAFLREALDVLCPHATPGFVAARRALAAERGGTARRLRRHARSKGPP